MNKLLTLATLLVLLVSSHSSYARFTQADTWQGIQHQPITLNKYTYANIDPVNNIDPTGNFSIGSFSAGASISASLGTIASSSFGRFFAKTAVTTLVVSRTVTPHLKREVKICRKTQGKKCRIPNLVVIGSNHQEAKDHIADTQKGLGSNGILVSPIVTYKKGGSGKNRQWYRNKPECKGNITSVSGKDCDEWPFFTTANGGLAGYNRKQVSLRLINSSDNRLSGGVWKRAVAKGQDGDKYTVVPSGPTSFYFSNGKFGF